MNTDRHLIKGKHLRMAVRGWSMRRKMMVAFAVPVILVSFVISLLSALYLQKKTEQQFPYFSVFIGFVITIFIIAGIYTSLEYGYRKFNIFF